MTADERLRELIHGGPYEPFQWIVMVRLAVSADDDGLVDVPELAAVSDWVSGPPSPERTDKRALYCLRRLRTQGWITVISEHKWDISRPLRQAPRAHVQ